MRIAAIGRTEVMFDTIKLLLEHGHQVPLIITSKEANEYSKTAADFENLAAEIGAEYIFTAKINSEEVIAKIKKLEKIDICVSINYSGIIEQEVIDLFSGGILNAHMGDLPRYRGNACQAWAIINGEERMGLCVYKMLGNYLDGGLLIVRKYFDLDITTTITDAWGWLNEFAPKMFLEAIQILSDNPLFYIEDTTKSEIKPMRCYPRIPEDSRIHWSQSNTEVIRLINASCHPFSGAFGFYLDKKIIIWKAILFEDSEEYLAIPGQVSQVHDDGPIDVITGNGKIRILEIEYDHVIYTKPGDLIKSIRNRIS